MLTHFLLALLKGKISLFAAAKIPLIATLLVLGSTGFVVTGTISGDEDEDEIELTVKPLESKKCIDALIAQTEALLQLDVMAAEASSDLRRMRERSRDRADDLHKDLDEVALLAQYDTSSTEIRDGLAAARQDVLAAADLDNCQDRDPDTTVDLVLADLRARYDQIVREFGQRLNTTLTNAQQAFDQLVASAPDKPRPPQEPSGDSGDSGSSDD